MDATTEDFDLGVKFPEDKRQTFSINTPMNLVTGRLYDLAKKLDLTVVSVYRHNLDIYEQMLNEAYENLINPPVNEDDIQKQYAYTDPAQNKKLFDDSVSTVSISTVIRQEGLSEEHKDKLTALLRRANRPDLADFVATFNTIEIALLIDRARYRVAYPPGEESEEVF